MFIHVLASALMYIVYFLLKGSSEKGELKSPKIVHLDKFLLFPSFVVYFIKNALATSKFNQIFADARDVTYVNLLDMVFYLFEVIVYAAAIRFILSSEKMSSKRLVFLGSVLLIEFLKAFMVASKAGAMGMLLFFVLLFLYRYGVRLKASIIFSLILLPNILFLMTMANIRNTVQRENLWKSLSFSEKAAYLYEGSQTMDYKQAFNDLGKFFSTRLHGVRSLTNFMDRTPAVYPYLLGSSYGEMVTNLVPRVLWKDKKFNDFGNMVSYNYFDAAYTTNVSPFVWGEPFLNFGLAGVFVFALLLALFMHAAEKLLDLAKNDSYVFSFILYSVYTYIMYQGNAARVIPGIIGRTIIFLVFWMILRNLYLGKAEKKTYWAS